MAEDRQKTPGIREIADALGVSIGTVDRALHGRPAISPATRARVLKTAEKLGYKPNVAARSLKLNRHLRIGVYLPGEIASFFDPLRAGIQAAADAASSVRVELTFHNFPRLDTSEVELLDAAVEQNFDGIIVAPGGSSKVDPSLRRLANTSTAVFCVAGDSPHSNRLGSLLVDPYICGAVAAELFSRTLKQTGSLATFTGSVTIDNHAEKLRGFSSTLNMLSPHLTLLPVIESHDLPEDAYRQAVALLDHGSLPLGIFISTANSMPVLQALEERKLFGKVEVITTDLFEELVPLIKSGKVLASIYQRPFTQGKAAFDLLLQYLTESIRPQSTTKLGPHIILRSNLQLFTRDLSPTSASHRL